MFLLGRGVFFLERMLDQLHSSELLSLSCIFLASLATSTNQGSKQEVKGQRKKVKGRRAWSTTPPLSSWSCASCKGDAMARSIAVAHDKLGVVLCSPGSHEEKISYNQKRRASARL